MRIAVASHAHRKLRRLERYIPAAEIADRAPAFAAQCPAESGKIVGVYRNDGTSRDEWIVFMTSGQSAVFDGVWRHISYSDISSVVWEEDKDVKADEVCLKLFSRARVTMLVNGKNVERGTHDKYEVMMFLESAIAVAAQDD
jgi:hypothetical protein